MIRILKVQKEFNNPDDIQFLGITFDPKRDTPEVLKNYKGLFNLDDNFDFLTADSKAQPRLGPRPIIHI